MNHRCLLLLCILVVCTRPDNDYVQERGSQRDGEDGVVFEDGGFGESGSSASGSGMFELTLNVLLNFASSISMCLYKLCNSISSSII